MSRGKSTLGRVLIPSTVEASCESLFRRRTSSTMLSSAPASSASRNSIRRRSLRSPSPGSWIPDGSQLKLPLVGTARSRHYNVRLASGRYPCSRAAKATEETKRKKTPLPKSNVTHLPQKHPNRHNHQHPPHLALLPPQPIQTPTHSPIKPRFTSTRTPARPRKRPRHIPRRRKPTAPQGVLNRPDPLPILPVKHPLPHLVQPAIRSPDMLARQSRYNSLVD